MKEQEEIEQKFKEFEQKMKLLEKQNQDAQILF